MPKTVLVTFDLISFRLVENLELQWRFGVQFRLDGALELAKKYDIIGDVRGGHGLMTGIELVANKAAKTPMDGATMQRVHQAAYEAGTMVRLGGNNILMSPPLTISETEVNTILSALSTGFAAA